MQAALAQKGLTNYIYPWHYVRYHYKTNAERLQWMNLNGDVVALNGGRWPKKWHLWHRASPPITRCRIDHPPHDRLVNISPLDGNRDWAIKFDPHTFGSDGYNIGQRAS